MNKEENYLEINRALWNARTAIHIGSDFYDMNDFMNGNSSLNSIELDELGDVAGKSILHLQCHFGQDTLSLARLGAKVCGIDFSEQATAEAEKISRKLNLDARFVCCDVYQAAAHVSEQFDIVFTSYGTIGWLPDLDRWARVIAEKLKPGGTFIIAEFHPVVWMFDNHFERVTYSYFKTEAIIEEEEGTYADQQAEIKKESVSWNHSLSEVTEALRKNGLQIGSLKEFDYSPYDCFRNTVKTEKGFQIKGMEGLLPMVYSIKARKGIV
ncbi:MAG: methyltransferase family protein [Bacteroidetes bacterium]|nr:MAG: methyltransferase family protein [Bacteroidota bacterium]